MWLIITQGKKSIMYIWMHTKVGFSAEVYIRAFKCVVTLIHSSNPWPFPSLRESEDLVRPEPEEADPHFMGNVKGIKRPLVSRRLNFH